MSIHLLLLYIILGLIDKLVSFSYETCSIYKYFESFAVDKESKNMETINNIDAIDQILLHF